MSDFNSLLVIDENYDCEGNFFISFNIIKWKMPDIFINMSDFSMIPYW